MNGDRDVVHVSKSANPRTSPSIYRKCAKGCSPSNLPVSKSSVFSSSISKGQSMNSGRRTRSSISETLLLPLDSERKRVVGGRVNTNANRSTVLTFSTPDVVVQDVPKDNQLDFPLMLKSSEEEMDKRNGCLPSDDGFYEHVPDSLRQPSSSEKVSKWLEDSQHSTMTDLSDNHSVSPDEDLEVKKRDDHEVTGRETCCKGIRVSEAADYENRSWPADNAPGINSTAQSPVKDPIDNFKGFSWLSLARRIIVGYLKVLTCLSVLYLGLLLQIRPTSWENYEPPPT